MLSRAGPDRASGGGARRIGKATITGAPGWGWKSAQVGWQDQAIGDHRLFGAS
jgi:hypothetical protein